MTDLLSAVEAQPSESRTWRDRSHGVARLTVLIYLGGALSTTVITWNLQFEDWYLYALMSLCTAIVVANYVRLGVRRSWMRRAVAMTFSSVVVLAWTGLLYEKTQVGWTVVDDVAVDLGAQGWFWIPVTLGLVTVTLLLSHLFVLMPRARREAGF